MHPILFMEEVFALLVMALALGMDAFSMSIGLGMTQPRLRQVFQIGIVIGVFHMFMPLLGILIGQQISEHFSAIAEMLGGVLLLILGMQMVCTACFGKKESSLVTPAGFGLFLFAFSVSLDSFSVGLSLGIYGARLFLSIFLFGLVSMMLTWCGLLMGRKFQHWIGTYGEVFGGCILFIFGLKLLFHHVW